MMRRLLTIALLSTTAAIPAAAWAQTNAAQNEATRNQAVATASAQRPIAVSQIKGLDVYSPSGEQAGEIERVLLGEGDRNFAVIRFGEFLGMGGESRVVPLNQIRIAGDRAILTRASRQDVQGFSQYNPQNAQYRELNDTQRVIIAVVAAGDRQQAARAQQQAGGQGAQAANRQDERTNIVVRDPAPAITVDQAAPDITIQQRQPTVRVRQPNPEIVVRQAPPRITVHQPQPEIIVRMPDPQVSVSMTQPQVQVDQPQPQVRVVQPQQQARVQVDREQPQVSLRQSQQQPRVEIERSSEPRVRYESSGEPNVTVQRAEGQPTVRYERVQSGEARQAQRRAAERGAAADRQQTRDATARATSGDRQAASREQDVATARERLGVGQVDTTASAAAGAGARRAVTVTQLEDMDVRNFRGEELGEIRSVIFANGRHYAILEHGGFLGMFENTVALPLERFYLRNNALYIRGVTEQDLDEMSNYRDRFANYRELGERDRLEVGVWQ